MESIKSLLNVISEHIKHDLYAIGFIGESLTAIRTYSDYIELKSQMFQATNDIKTSLEYLFKLSNEENKKIPEKVNESASQTSQMETKKEEQNKEPLKVKNDYNEILKQDKCEKRNLEHKQQTQNYIQNEHNKLQQQSPITSLVPSSNTNVLGTNKISIKDNTIINATCKPNDQTKQTIAQSTNISNQSELKKQKISKIVNLISKINSDKIVKNIILQLFGKNIIDEMTSSKVEDSVLDNIKQIITKIDSASGDDNVDAFKQPKQPDLQPMSQFQKSQPIKTSSHRLNSSKRGKSYADALLHSKGLVDRYPTEVSNSKVTPINNNNKAHIRMRNRNNKTISPTLNNQKTFVNYTSPHGSYFDTSLQKGGNSSIPVYTKTKSKTKNLSFMNI